MIRALLLLGTAVGIQIIKVRPWANIATCQFSGTEIVIIREALASQNKTEGTDYQFECLSPSELPVPALLASPTSLLVGGLVINSSAMKGGVSFSVPTFRSGLSMMVRTAKSPGLWNVFAPLNVAVWVLFFSMPLFVGLFNFGYSALLSPDRLKALKDLSPLPSHLSSAYAKLFTSRTEPADFGHLALACLVIFSRLILLCYICTFAAQQYNKVQEYIEDIKDITGKRTFVPVGLRSETAQFPIMYYPKFPDNTEDPVSILKGGDILVYIDDHAVLCSLEDQDVEVHSQPFRGYSYGVMIGPEVSKDVVAILNMGLSYIRETTRVVDLLEDGNLVQLPIEDKSTNVDLDQVWGVFIIMGIGAGMAFALSFIPYPSFFSHTWRCCLPTSSDYSQPSQPSHPSTTTRTEALDGLEMTTPPVSYKASTTEVSFTIEELTQSPSVDESETDSKLTSIDPVVAQETVELIRTTTLMLLLFETSFSEGINRFAHLVEKEETRKTQLTEVINEFD